jgi:hypothetical protein
MSPLLIYNENKKFWEELIAYFPFIRPGPHRRTRPTVLLLLSVLVVAVTCLPSRYIATVGGYGGRFASTCCPPEPSDGCGKYPNGCSALFSWRGANLALQLFHSYGSWASAYLLLKLENRWTDFDEICYGHYGSGGYPKHVVISYDLIGIVTGLDGRGSIPDRSKILLISTGPKPALGPIQPPIKWVLLAVCPG